MTRPHPSKPDSDLITPGEAAALLGVGTPALAKRSRKGQIRSVRMPGGQNRYFRADVEAIRRKGEGG